MKHHARFDWGIVLLVAVLAWFVWQTADAVNQRRRPDVKITLLGNDGSQLRFAAEQMTATFLPPPRPRGMKPQRLPELRQSAGRK